MDAVSKSKPPGPEMSIQDAKTNLHNLAQMFMAPLILLEALTVVEAKTAEYGELVDQVDTLQKQRTSLEADCKKLAETKRELERDATEFARRKDILQAEVDRLVARFAEAVQQPAHSRPALSRREERG